MEIAEKNNGAVDRLPAFLRWPFSRGRHVVTLPALAALLVSLPLLAAPGALLGPDTFRSYDWLESAKLDAFSRISLLGHGSLPHWNPYLQGGFPQLAHPSDSTLSPLILPVLLLGEELGMKLNVLLALALGAIGTALLGRDRLDLRVPYATFAGCAFALAGWVPCRVAVGYYESTLYGLFPMMAWLFLTSTSRPWRLLGAAALLAVCALQLHIGLPVLMLALALLTLAELLRRRLAWSHTLRFVLLCAGGAGLAAAKLVPMWSYLSTLGFRREQGWSHDAFYVSLRHMLNNLWDVVPAMGTYDARGVNWSMEYGHLGLGIPLLVLAGYAMLRFFAVPGGQRVVAALALLFAWICFGFNAPLDLYQPLWSLPLFHSMRGALRYISFVLLWMLCLLAAGGLQMAARGIGKYPLPSRVVAAVAVLALVWPAAQSFGLNVGRFSQHARLPASPPSFRQEAMQAGDGMGLHRGGDARYDMGNMLSYVNLKAGVGTVYVPGDLRSKPRAQGHRVYDVTGQRYVGNPGYRGEAWCEGHACGARVVEVRANLLRVRARLSQADVLVLNQNFHPLWTANRGRIGQHGGLLGCALDAPGEVELELRYRPALFYYGLAVSLGTAALGLLCAWLVARRNRRRAGRARQAAARSVNGAKCHLG